MMVIRAIHIGSAADKLDKLIRLIISNSCRLNKIDKLVMVNKLVWLIMVEQVTVIIRVSFC